MAEDCKIGVNILLIYVAYESQFKFPKGNN